MSGCDQRRARTWLVLLVLISSPLGLLTEARPAGAEPVEVGYRDHSFSGASAPTGQKPQSKLWFNDGLWWGNLFNSSTRDFHIYRYDTPTHTWIDTGTKTDTRASSSADALWDGTHLYIASATASKTSSGAGKVFRYSYNTATKKYTIDSGWPKAITSSGMEALVFEKDTTGKLWVTFTQGNKVYVTHTTTNETTWLTPYVIPVTGASNLTPDDISAIVAFNRQIGVMWSNQNDSAMYFAIHGDGAGEEASDWRSEVAFSFPEGADDHINLKHLEADAAGEVFAAAKTSLNASNDPLIQLLVRKPGPDWQAHVFGTVADDHTRAIVMLDESNRELYMFAASPCCSGGVVYMKKSGFDNISFPPGKGTPFIRSGNDPQINNPTSTKQNVTNATGLLVAAGDDSTKRYLHNFVELGGASTPPPDTTIDSGPSGTVNSSSATFTFSSHQAGATFECSLDGAAFATCASPHNYAGLADGQHTLQVRAITANGTDPTPASRTWTVQTATALFSDGFESGSFSAWSRVLTGGDGAAVAQTATVRSGTYAARLSATTTTGSFAYARKTLSSDLADSTVSGDFRITREGSSGGNVPILRLFDSGGVRRVSLFRQNAAGNKVYVNHGSGNILTTGLLPLDTWGRFELHVVLAGSGADTVEIKLNGAQIYRTTTATVGTSGIRTIQIGNDTKAQAFTIVADTIEVR